MQINMITNGLLLTPEIVDRLAPLGLNGDQGHARRRPRHAQPDAAAARRSGDLRQDRQQRPRRSPGSAGSRSAATSTRTSVDSYPALLDFLREQEFADKLAKVAFKPIIKPPQPAKPKGMIPLTAVSAEGKPLGGACMTSAGTGVSSVCDNCNFLDEKMSFLREETVKRGFPTVDGVHMGPCEIHKHHAHTIGPDGSLYACPGFAGDAKESTGHIDGREEAWRSRQPGASTSSRRGRNATTARSSRSAPAAAASRRTPSSADMNKPNCHKSSFEAGLITLARQAAANAEPALIG